MIGSEDFSINGLQQLQSFVYLCEQPPRRQRWHGRIKGELVVSMRQSILDIIRKIEATGKLKRQNGSDISVAVAMKFNSIKVLE